MKTITVFTPTYNRAHTLPNLYKSLLEQTVMDFEWLIVDDGSTDGTMELVQAWISEGAIPIRYIRQENGGMLTAHNKAYDNINTELNVCIDSDDSMTPNSIEVILRYYKEHLIHNKSIAGIIGLNINPRGYVVGKKFSVSPILGKWDEIVRGHKKIGDKKHVYKTSIINEYARYPVFPSERYPAAGMLYLRIAQQYSVLCINEPLCVVEYLPDGNTRNKIRQYYKNPNAFAAFRLEKMALPITKREKFICAAHYVSSRLIAKKPIIETATPEKLIILLSIPMGIFLYIYIIYKNRKEW